LDGACIDMYSTGFGIGYGFSVAGVIHLLLKRPYIVVAIGGALIWVSLMKPVPLLHSPAPPSVPVNWSNK